MMKTTLVYALALTPVVFGVKLWIDAVSLHDDHILTVARCMNETRKALDISAEEAYIDCERKVR